MSGEGNRNAVSGIDIHELEVQAASIGRTIATMQGEQIRLLVRIALLRDELNRAAERAPARAGSRG